MWTPKLSDQLNLADVARKNMIVQIMICSLRNSSQSTRLFSFVAFSFSALTLLAGSFDL